MESTDDGGSWSALTNGGGYEGVGSAQLTISNVDTAMSGNLYRLDVSNGCAPRESEEVELTVWENPVAAITGDLASFPKLCGGDTLYAGW